MGAITAILAFLQQSWVGQIVSAGLSWWNARKAAQDQAQTDEQNAENQHQSDGAQSVEDRDSADAQNAALDQIQNQMDNPTPVIVTPPGGNDVKPGS